MSRFFKTPEEFSTISDEYKKAAQPADRTRDRDVRPSRETRPIRINFNQYFEKDSVGDCDTAGVRIRVFNTG